MNQFTSFEGFDSEYVKLHSGGPIEVEKGAAGGIPGSSWPPSSSRRRGMQKLKVGTPEEFRKLSNEVLFSFDTAFFQKL